MGSLINLLMVTILTFTIILKVVAYPTEDILNLKATLRIVGGNAAKEANFPYAAAIQLTDHKGMKYECAGALISSTSILTAAHCLEDIKSVEVTLGALNVSQASTEKHKQMFDSKTFIVHPKFNEHDVDNDLAIIKLNHPAKLDTHVKIIHIPTNDKESYARETGTTMGWGLTSIDGGRVSLPNLHYKTNPVLTDADCIAQRLNFKTRVSTVQTFKTICLAGGEGQSTCVGDSGAPLVVKNILVGILSFGSLRCDPGYVSVFTRLSKYIQWINDHK